VLARLERLEGIHTAETDEAGDFLRLVVGFDTAGDAAIRALAALGYGAERTSEAPLTGRWFGARTVRELSLIEAGVIADRVVPQLASRPAPEVVSRLRAAIIAALHASFISTELTSATSGRDFRDDCVRQAVAAATPIVGTAVADEVGRLLDLDMRETHKTPRAG
jgi:hypothetical protein